MAEVGQHWKPIIGAVLGLVVEMPAVLLAVMSGGAGHGDYLYARLLFPFSMASTFVTGEISSAAIAAALLQFPVYGFLIGYGLTDAKRRWIIALVVLFHVIMLAATMGNPNFS